MNDQYNKQSCRILLSNNIVQILCSVLLLPLPKLKVAVIVKKHLSCSLHFHKYVCAESQSLTAIATFPGAEESQRCHAKAPIECQN
jgi:hypothetical protein